MNPLCSVRNKQHASYRQVKTGNLTHLLITRRAPTNRTFSGPAARLGPLQGIDPLRFLLGTSFLI